MSVAATDEAQNDISAAVASLQRGDSAEAEARCRAVLARFPAHRDARVLLGLVLHSQERFAQAEELFTQLTQDEPGEASHWANLGTVRRGGRRFDEALQAYAQAMRLGLNTALLLHDIGLTHIDRLDFEAARAVLGRAATLAPRDAEIRYRYAHACLSSLRTEEAQQAILGWDQLDGLDSELLAQIGLLLMNLGDAQGGELALQQAALDPAPKPVTTLTLVQAFERLNRLEQARAHLTQLQQVTHAGQLGTDIMLADATLAEREGQRERAIELLNQALTRVTEPHLRHFQLFPLARALDALGRYEQAFATLREAHASQSAWLRLAAPAVSLRQTPIMAATQFAVDAADVARWDHTGAPGTDDSPIFVVGFPRSGTTLLELTLDAHSALVSMDEQSFLQSALRDLQQYATYPESLAGVAPAQLQQVRAAYWSRVRRRVKLEPGQRLVDKNPLNILRLPAIGRLFPNARILLAVRHPCDVLLSCYMQHFRAPEFALVCVDLASLALAYQRAFDFWFREQAVLQIPAREVVYEALVTDFESEVRSISDFLALPWDERMLEPAAHARDKGFISTPSYSQVVQPVNRRSIGRWQHYRAHFEPVLPQLQPYLDRWHYEV
ncbi:MAG TPA: sulfotransferase [Steroidobacteraceae bacterium]|nr:sulfotransferase [Steroidobacteraceae bacterium]